jgi:carotenoid cleavage dioxygenase-like enzyme
MKGKQVKAVFDLGFSKTDAERVINSLPVQGRIPAWLSGTLVRNGPGSFHVGQQTYRHWFDGLAMLHRFTISDGRVSYANKFLQTKAYQTSQAEGRITYSEFATDPCRSLFSRVMAVFDPHITDSAKVSVANIAGKYMALAETPIQVIFDPQTLESVGVFQYEPRLVGQMTTVHPHFDNNNAFNLVTRYNAVSQYNIFRVNGQTDGSQPAVKRIASLPVTKPAYLHSFGMSQNYFIIAEFPLVVNSVDLLLWLRPYIENFKWEPQRGTRFWVVDRRTGQLAGRYDCDAFFAFHHINAFERGKELFIDLAAYNDAEIVQSYYLNRLSDSQNELPFGSLRRYRIALDGPKPSRVTSEIVSDACMELPNTDYLRCNTNPDYRYVYAISLQPQQRAGFYNRLIKVDIKTGQVVDWSAPGCYPGEPVFVRRPGSQAEDDGLILSVVLDINAETSYLLVLDAASFHEIARAVLPHPVLFGYHGAFFDQPGMSNRKGTS